MDKIIRWFKGTLFYYWIVLVLWRAICKAIPIRAIGDKIMEFLISVIVSIVLLYVWNIKYPIPYLGSDNLLTILIIVIVTFIIRVIVGIIYTPFSLNKEKDNSINSLQEKWENPPLPNPLNISFFNDEVKNRVAIKIENPTLETISNVKVELVSLKWINDKYEEVKVTDEINSDNRLFKFGKGFGDSFSISPIGGKAFIYLAQEKESTLFFLLEEEVPNKNYYWTIREEQKYIELAKKAYPLYKGNVETMAFFIIELSIYGEIDGKPLEKKTFSDWIRHGRTILDLRNGQTAETSSVLLGIEILEEKGYINRYEQD